MLKDNIVVTQSHRFRLYSIFDKPTNVKVPWCSGYHVRFTRERSRVRSSLGPQSFSRFAIENSNTHSSNIFAVKFK